MNSPSSNLQPASLNLEEACLAELEGQMEMPLLGAANEASLAARAAFYHLQSGGHRVRARLALQAGRALALSQADALTLAATAELLHNASLVHDDLQDDAVERHGKATAGLAFGTNTAICTGDLLLSAAYGRLATFSKTDLLPELLGLVHDRVAGAIRGQCAGFSNQAVGPKNMAWYRQVAIDKSGALLSLPLELAFLGAGKKNWLLRVRLAAEEFALGYQILDDVEDAGSDGPEAINAVALLRAAGHGADSSAEARRRGVRHLKNAAQAARAFPNGAGDLLESLSLALAERH